MYPGAHYRTKKITIFLLLASSVIIIVIIILISSPDSRAQHCNYATLLAGRCINNLWYSIILPMGPSFLSMLVFVVRGIVYLCSLCVYFPGFYFATISGLSLSFSLPRCASSVSLTLHNAALCNQSSEYSKGF